MDRGASDGRRACPAKGELFTPRLRSVSGEVASNRVPQQPRCGGVTRIIAGAHGGRRLSAPAGVSTRPTSDRVREALFSALDTMTDLSGARFADLYAGSGAVGLEALSRGAKHALLVESDARAARAIRDNIVALKAGAAARLITGKVSQVLAGSADGGV